MTHRPQPALLFAAVAWLFIAPSAQGQAEPGFALRINSGGGAVVAADGTRWEGDAAYATGGDPFTMPGAVGLDKLGRAAASSAGSDLWKTVRHWDHRFTVRNLAPGRYRIRIHLAEAMDALPLRQMTYLANGATLFENLSPRQLAGGALQGAIAEADAEVGADGVLVIQCRAENEGGDVFEAGIEILSSAEAQPARFIPDLLAGQRIHDAAISKKVSDFVGGGGGARLVWCQTAQPMDFYANGASCTLWGLDTTTEAGPVGLLPDQVRSFSKPFFTPDGGEVVFSDSVAKKCYGLNWETGALRTLADGSATDVWDDPADGARWLYYRTAALAPGPIHRRRIDGDSPGRPEPAWTSSNFPAGIQHGSWFRLSDDGRMATDAFPYPRPGIADLRTGEVSFGGSGCWTDIEVGNTGRWFHLVNPHTSVLMFAPGKRGRRVDINGMLPGQTTAYHPRWSNRGEFLTATAPQWTMETELYIGRFNRDRTAITEWLQVTRNAAADAFGDLWIAP